MEEAKIYGLCLQRLKYQIENARDKGKSDTSPDQERYLLESYNTGETEDIIDILELYDVENSTAVHVQEKLEELAYTVSLMLRETLSFGWTADGHLGLYLLMGVVSPQVPEEEVVAA